MFEDRTFVGELYVHVSGYMLLTATPAGDDRADRRGTTILGWGAFISGGWRDG